MSLTAITRQVSPRIAECELTHLDRAPIDYDLAAEQHRGYEQALTGLGCRLRSLPSEADFPDSVFVEDVAVVLDEIAILARPGPLSRRGEVAQVAPVLGEYRELRGIEPPGTLEGGDVLRDGRTIFVGLSGRTNQAGVDQLRSVVEPLGYSVTQVRVTECLHLKSAVSPVGPRSVLINPVWLDRGAFRGFQRLEIDPSEPYAANALKVGERVIYPSSFPRTADRLARRGLLLELVDVSELQKAEGAVTCCSLVFESGQGH
jgi:dimethylargininase